jgi:large subunit ribosomal protein L15
MAQEIGLHSLKPKDGSRHRKKRVGRGEGSGSGKTSGRGEKGAGARSGSKKRANFEGGQMPIHMRLRKLRGPHMKKSMPFEQFRTQTQPVNLKDLAARFDSGAEVTPETLREKGLATRKDIPVKILGEGDLGKKLTIRVHYASKSAREKIEGAGGTLELLVEPKKPKPAKQKPAPPAEPVAEAEPEEAPTGSDPDPEPTEAPDATQGSDPEAPEEE